MCPMARYKAQGTAVKRAIWLSGGGHCHTGSESPAPPEDFSSLSPPETKEEVVALLDSSPGERPLTLHAFVSHTPGKGWTITVKMTHGSPVSLLY